jgi:uncharacterized OsmC-like protein
MAHLDSYLARKASVLAQRRDDFQADPARAVVPLKATSHCAGITGVRPVRMGDYIVVSDSAPGLAGNSLGPSSPEMLLGALASCLVHTYLLQAALLGIPLDSVTIDVQGHLDMTGVVGLPSAGPAQIEELRYTPTVSSPASAEAIAALHAAVASHCAVLNTLRLPQAIACHLPDTA